MTASNTPSALLTPEERERFATWLEWDASTDEELATRMVEFAPPAFVDMRRADAAAKRRIAQLLRATESVSL